MEEEASGEVPVEKEAKAPLETEPKEETSRVEAVEETKKPAVDAGFSAANLVGSLYEDDEDDDDEGGEKSPEMQEEAGS